MTKIVIFGELQKGRRTKTRHFRDPEVPGRVTRVHSVMKKAGQFPADWELSQCLFGEHLLAQYPGKPMGLVESEKTAVIAAGLCRSMCGWPPVAGAA